MLYVSQFVDAAQSGPLIDKFYSLLRGEDLMQVHSNAINLVIGRDLHRNVLYASTMAREMADKGKRVFYLNTYASEQLLRNSFQADAAPAPDAPEIALENLATGEWNTKKLTDMLEEQKSEVLIINSFEFAEFSRYGRQTVARDLIALQKKLSLSVVVFSHEMKRDIEAHSASRGAIGMLASVAESVSKVGDEWRVMMLEKASSGVPTAENPYGNRRVNEKQTLNKYFLPKKFGGVKPDPTVDIPNDRGYSYHYGDFWTNPFERGPSGDYSGRGMALLARTPLLLKYLYERPNQIFHMGNTPTEAKLYAEQTLQPCGQPRPNDIGPIRATIVSSPSML